MIEQHLRDMLIADTSVYAEIGTRIYPQFVPEASQLPAIAFSMISDQAHLAMNGPLPNRTPTIQISIVADTQPEVGRVAELIKSSVNSWEATYSDMVVADNYAEGGVYLSLDYYIPKKHGMVIEAFLNWRPV